MIKDPLVELKDATYSARSDDGLLDLSSAPRGRGSRTSPIPQGFCRPCWPHPSATWRSRFLRHRGGYVRLSQARREWERRNLASSWASVDGRAGHVALLPAVGRGPGGDVSQWLAPGVISPITAAMVGRVAAVSLLPRLAW